jgi:hypothetical protein
MGDVEQIAIRVGISPRAVYKNLDAGAMRDLARIFTDITNALNAQLEE